MVYILNIKDNYFRNAMHFTVYMLEVVAIIYILLDGNANKQYYEMATNPTYWIKLTIDWEI